MSQVVSGNHKLNIIFPKRLVFALLRIFEYLIPWKKQKKI